MDSNVFFGGRPSLDPNVIKAVRDIEKSGLTPEIVSPQHVSIFAGTPAELANDLNISEESAVQLIKAHTLIRFPYFGKDGKDQTIRYKFIPPIRYPDGREAKYLSPSGSHPEVYVPSPVWPALDDPTAVLWITEGEKKTLKLNLHGACCVGLPGVYCFREKKSEGCPPTHRELHPTLRKTQWRGRKVMIAFDADFRDNPDVRNALIELALRLQHGGADVHVAHWDPARGKGIDDVLAVADKPDETLAAILRTATPLQKFIEPDHADAVVRALAISAKTASEVEVRAKELAKFLRISLKTLTADVKKRQTDMLLYHKTVKRAEIVAGGDDYAFKDGTLVRNRDGKPEHLADFEARITKELHLETGDSCYRVEGKSIHGASFAFDTPACEFADPKLLRVKLEQAMGPCASCSASATPHLGPAIKRLSELSQITHGSLYRRTGWLDTRFLIPGNTIEGIEVNLGHRKMPYSLSDKADFTLGIEALTSLLKAQIPEVTTVILTFLFQAPFSRLVGWEEERYCLFICGRTGNFKTSTVQAMMCIWGAGFASEDNLIKWGEGATKNALMELAVFPRDMPMLIDNYKPNTGGGARDFTTTMHNMLEGGQKDRLTKSAELRDSKPVSCWPICTGEDVPDNDAASLARTLVIRMKRIENADTEDLTRAQELSRHLPAIGEVVIRYLEALAENESARALFKERFFKYRKEWNARLKAAHPKMPNIPRVSTNLASNQLTWEVFSQIPELAQVLYPLRDAHAAGLKAIAAEMAGSVTEASEAEKFLEAVRDLISRKEIDICSTRVAAASAKPLNGWWEEDGSLCISFRAIQPHLEKTHQNLSSLSDRTLYKQLEELGVLASRDAEHRTKSVNIGGCTQRVLHLKGEFVRYAAAPGNPEPELKCPFDTDCSTEVPF